MLLNLFCGMFLQAEIETHNPYASLPDRARERLEFPFLTASVAAR
jgi:hypothetical protein